MAKYLKMERQNLLQLAYIPQVYPQKHPRGVGIKIIYDIIFNMSANETEAAANLLDTQRTVHEYLLDQGFDPGEAQIKIPSSIEEADTWHSAMSRVLGKNEPIDLSELPFISAIITEGDGKSKKARFVTRTVNPSQKRLFEEGVVNTGISTTDEGGLTVSHVDGETPPDSIDDLNVAGMPVRKVPLLPHALVEIAGQLGKPEGSQSIAVFYLAGTTRIDRTFHGGYRPTQLNQIAESIGQVLVQDDPRDVVIASTVRMNNSLPGRSSADRFWELTGEIDPKARGVHGLMDRKIPTALCTLTIPRERLEQTLGIVTDLFMSSKAKKD